MQVPIATDYAVIARKPTQQRGKRVTIDHPRVTRSRACCTRPVGIARSRLQAGHQIQRGSCATFLLDG